MISICPSTILELRLPYMDVNLGVYDHMRNMAGDVVQSREDWAAILPKVVLISVHNYYMCAQCTYGHSNFLIQV